jgi:hypothetical protein
MLSAADSSALVDVGLAVRSPGGGVLVVPRHPAAFLGACSGVLATVDQPLRSRRDRTVKLRDPQPSNPWHYAWCKSYDHAKAGHRRWAAVWGWIADRMVNHAVFTR